MSDDTPSPLNNVITIDDEGRFPRVDESAASARASSFARRRPRRPKACGGCALKASDCKDRVAGPQRSGIRMDVSDRCAPGKMRSRASTSLASGGVSA